MARFNTAVKTGVRSPVLTVAEARTALGGDGYERDPKSELFLLAVSNMASPGGAFHESGKDRDARYTRLIKQVCTDTNWFTGFLGFLRDTANMRSASIIAAADAVHARLTAGITGGNREMITRVLQRADEPGELLAYWTATHGRNIPQPVKRGITDALARLYTERAYLKWDSESRGFRFADVIQLTHPDVLRGRLSRAEYAVLSGDELPSAQLKQRMVARGLVDQAGLVTDSGNDLYRAVRWRTTLYKHILDDRYQSAPDIPEGLATIRARAALMAVPVAERRSVTAGQLAEAGMTWESLAGWLQGPMDACAWESAIPSMGYMALLRNLRNFDQAGISKTARREVEDRLTDPEQVAKSRQLPMRFLSAYRATRYSGTVTAWGPVIEEALNLSLGNVPELTGRTLVLVDLSGSMRYSILSDKSGLRYVDAASVFGAAIAKRNDADLFGFDNRLISFPKVKPSDSLLPLADTIAKHGGGGTSTAAAIQASYKGHDRIIIVTDEQAGYGYGTDVDHVLKSTGVPSYTWNLAGYRVGHAQSGSRKQHTFGGLSDSAFRMIPLIEAGEHQSWPWS